MWQITGAQCTCGRYPVHAADCMRCICIPLLWPAVPCWQGGLTLLINLPLCCLQGLELLHLSAAHAMSLSCSAALHAGAADCASCVATLLELARLVVQNPSMQLSGPLIFLLNGGEETAMQASHGFISQVECCIAMHFALWHAVQPM